MARQGFLIDTKLAETPQNKVEAFTYEELLALYLASHKIVEGIDWLHTGIPSDGSTGPFANPYFLAPEYQIIADELILAGNLVNVQWVGGQLVARLATAADKEFWCNGFSNAGGAAGTPVDVQTLAGINSTLAMGFAVGTPYWLDTVPGQLVATPPPSGQITQFVGFGISATELHWMYSQPVIR